MIGPKGFFRRLVLFLVLVIVVVQLFSAALAYSFLRRSLFDQGKIQLTAATGLFMRQMDALSQQVSDSVEVLSQDYPLRQAIAQKDHNTVLSTLRNHGRRVGASRMMLISLEGIVADDTLLETNTGVAFPFSDMLDEAAADGRSAALVTLNGVTYWMAVVPVKAPVPIAFIAAGVPVDDERIEDLRQLSGPQNSIAIATVDRSGNWVAVARSSGHSPAIRSPPPSQQFALEPSLSEEAGRQYLTFATQLETASRSPPVAAILDYSLDDAFRQFRALVGILLVVLAAGLIIAILGAIWIGRAVSRPVESLAATARRIEKGDYTPPPKLDQHDELGELSASLTAMVAAIREREAALMSAAVALEAANAEAVMANHAKSQFLSNMSHEFRTPLNAIIGFGEVIKDEILGPVGTPDYVEYAGYIHDSGCRLLSLVDRMFDLVEIDSGKLKLFLESVDVGRIATDAIGQHVDAAAKAGVTIVLDGDPDLWPAVKGDRDRLRQVFLNVIDNAIHFTPNGGCLTIAGERDGEMLYLRFADTGVGMKAEDIPHAIQPFFRVSAAFDTQYEGAGLGLPLVNAVVTSHGGRLKIDSTPGAGTTVTIILPCHANDRGIDNHAA